MDNCVKNKKPLVSVCVITYNHEKYISECLNSILSQQVDFEYEIIIRDDGSSDNTLEIIESFVIENSKIRNISNGVNFGANANLLMTFKYARGEYISICEGDDYWVDVLKIKKQVQCAQNNNKSFITHGASILDNGVVINKMWPCQQSSFFTINDVLKSVGQFAPTASYFFRRNLLSSLPIWFDKAPIGDFFIELYFSSFSGGVNIFDSMSIYRISSINSWEDKIRKDVSGMAAINMYRRIKIYLRKTIIDFPAANEYIQARISFLDFSIAHHYMKAGNYDCFVKYIEKSNNHINNMGLLYRLLFVMRRIEFMIRLMYRIKRIL